MSERLTADLVIDGRNKYVKFDRAQVIADERDAALALLREHGVGLPITQLASDTFVAPLPDYTKPETPPKREHRLKTWPDFFDALLSGAKKRREKCAAADVWSEMERRCREYVKAHNPEAYASRGRIEPGYVEAHDDMADIAQEMAEQLRKEAEAGNVRTT